MPKFFTLVIAFCLPFALSALAQERPAAKLQSACRCVVRTDRLVEEAIRRSPLPAEAPMDVNELTGLLKNAGPASSHSDTNCAPASDFDAAIARDVARAAFASLSESGDRATLESLADALRRKKTMDISVAVFSQ
jgi:hypothetical protein